MANQLKRLQQARTGLLLEHPFFGALSLRLKLIEDSNIPTAATDGTVIRYNPEFTAKQTPAQLRGLLAHEVMHCFPAGTMIAGTDKPIEAIGIGNVLIGTDSQPTTVVDTFTRDYDGELFTVKPRGLLPIECTSEHPFLTVQPTWKTIETPLPRRNTRQWSVPAWKTAEQLTTDDWLLVPRAQGTDTINTLNFQFGNAWSVPAKVRSGVSLTRDIAELIGWYVAEGYSNTKTGSIGFAMCVDELKEAEFLRSVLCTHFGYKSSIQPAGENGIQVMFSSAPLARFLSQHCGAGAENKRIPSFLLYHENTDLLKAFLRGYIAGDGHTGPKGIHFGTVSRILAMQLQIAFARLGVVINLHKRNAYRSWFKGVYINSKALYHGHSRSQTVFDTLSVDRNVSRPTRQSYEVGAYMAVKIRSINKRLWHGTVYNMETTDHAYVAGNVLTHNCSNGHPWRRDGRDGKKFNMACDYAINPLLTASGLTLPDGGLNDAQYAGLSAEAIYGRLPDPPKDDPKGNGNDPGGSGGVEDSPQDSGNDPADAPQTEAEWKQATLVAAKQAEKQGTLPAGMERLLGAIRKPECRDLVSALREFVGRSAREDYSWRRPNPRYIPHGLYMPTLHSETMPPVVAAVDTSGSVSADLLAQYAAALQVVLDECRPERLSVMACDAKVHSSVDYEPGDMVSTDAKSYAGGGGTDFRPVFDAIGKSDEQPCCAVYLTDLAGYFPEVAPNIPTLWVCIDARQSRPVAPWGETIYLNG